LDARVAATCGSSEGRPMTAVEIARTRLATAIAARKMRATKTSPRHDDSCMRSQLESRRESVLPRSMTTTADALPEDSGALRALILAERAAHAAAVIERDQLVERNAALESLNKKLEHIVAELRRAHFGRKSERISDDQLALALEELETAAAKAQAQAEKIK